MLDFIYACCCWCINYFFLFFFVNIFNRATANVIRVVSFTISNNIMIVVSSIVFVPVPVPVVFVCDWIVDDDVGMYIICCTRPSPLPAIRLILYHHCHHRTTSPFTSVRVRYRYRYMNLGLFHIKEIFVYLFKLIIIWLILIKTMFECKPIINLKTLIQIWPANLIKIMLSDLFVFMDIV